MKKNPSSKLGFITRNVIALLLVSAAISLAMVSFAGTSPKQLKTRKTILAGPKPNSPTIAPSPTSGTLTSANLGSANAINWADTVGTVPNFTFFAGNGTCAAPGSCSTFTVTIDPSVTTPSGGYDPTKYEIFVELSWAQSAFDYDTWICSGGGNCTQANVVGSNASTADPEVIVLPTTLSPGTYTINAVMTNGGPTPYNGTIYLAPLPASATCTGDCRPPRYQNYPAPAGMAENAGEPSIGVDWNPNVASLKFQDATHNVNHDGVAFMTMNGDGSTQNGPLGEANYRINFDDCPSPAINKWEDVSSTFAQESALIDPIGFTDHYSSSPLGLAYPEPHTPGRMFQIELIGGQGNSQGGFSDDDGNSYTPGGNGGPGQGPDHETLGGGPYNQNAVPPPPPTTVYPNAIYYCSQNIAGEAECSRSDDGGQTFGPGVLIYNPAQCVGGIHGHVKVSPDGTVYVPNSSCGTGGGTTGVAVSIDNGLTWTENNVPGSFSTQDPSVGVGQNGVGKPAGNLNGTNTIYLGYIDGDGRAKIAHSGDRGATWSTPATVGTEFGVTKGVFPVVVAGDDNRAAFGFLGTTDGISTNGQPCDPYGATLNCANIWHLYISTTYDGGANWITIDATPNDPVQTGTVCLQGTFCAGGRNLLDFNDFGIDAEGRGLLGYADGCVNCGNTFQGQSSAAHGTVARQSGGRRLFAAFDPNPAEPYVPAPPQIVSAIVQSSPSGNLVTWLEPDNGGSPITSYKLYRGVTSGGEVFLTNVPASSTKYLDTTAPSGNVFYYVTAVNAIGEGTHCGEVSTQVVVSSGSSCTAPYIKVQNAAAATNDPTGQFSIQNVNMGEPFISCNVKQLTALLKVNTMDPSNTGTAVVPPVSTYEVYFKIPGSANSTGQPQTLFMEYDNTTEPQGVFLSGWIDPATGADCSTLYLPNDPTNPMTGTIAPDGTITMNLNLSSPVTFATCAATGGTNMTISPSQWTPGTQITNIQGKTFQRAGGIITGVKVTKAQTTGDGTYVLKGNRSCQGLLPIAALSGSPLSGNAPLTVNFDATGSHEQSGACGTINSYTLDFGDGSAPVTNSTGHFSHTYNSTGDFPARLTVSDDTPQTSTNPAQVTVSVTNGVNLVSVVSRMTHGTITPPFEVNLPLTGTRGVECRSSGSLGAGNYQIVFQFDNALTSVGGASVSTGTGTVSSSGIGLNDHEYIVNLTGVANAQYIAVTLTGVAGAANNGTVVGPQMGVLIGDTTANGTVNSSDIAQTQSQSGHTVGASNFREDVTANGVINSSDIGLVQSKSGTALPSQP